MDGTWFAEDLGSANGTVVNGNRIAEATPLAAGDEIKLSDCLLLVRSDAAAAVSVPPEAAGLVQ